MKNRGKVCAVFYTVLLAFLGIFILCGCQNEMVNKESEVNKLIQNDPTEPEATPFAPKEYTGTGYVFNGIGGIPWDRYGSINGWTGNSDTVLVSSEAEVQEVFGEVFTTNYCYDAQTWVQNSNFQDVIRRYDEEYFQNHQLLSFFFSTGGGGDRYEIESVVYEEDVLTVSFNIIRFGGTAAITYWFAVMEIPKIPTDAKIEFKIADPWKFMDWDIRFGINRNYYMLTPVVEVVNGGFEILDNVLWKYTGEGKNVVIPDGITAIGRDAFNKSAHITSLFIPQSVVDIDSQAFSGLTSLVTITAANENPVYKSEANCLIRKSDNVLILGCKTSVIPNSVTAIGTRAFYRYGELGEIIIPDSVTVIGSSAFYGCSGKINIPDSVTHIRDSAFYNFNGPIKTGNGLKVIEGYAFYGCKGLTEISLAEGAEKIEILAFAECVNLKSISIPDGVMLDGGFWNCTSLIHIRIPEGNTIIYGTAFRNCRSLASVIIPASVTAVYWYAFDGCTSLTKVFYGGDESMWNRINISRDGNGHLPLVNATRYYYSETRPAVSGNFWRYDTDGVTPVIW